jgi:polyhydroxybutyrate depolymerase
MRTVSNWYLKLPGGHNIVKVKTMVSCGLVAALICLMAGAQLIGRRMRERQERESGFPAKGDPSTARKITFSYGGVERYYLVQSIESPGLHPVVVVLHGGTQDAKKVWRQSSLPTLGLQEGFVVVAPDAIDGHWNDGRGAVLGGRVSTADDVGFLRQVIADVLQNQHGDPNAVFMVGVSNGGFMTMHFACEAGTLLHAAGNVISDMPVDQEQTCHAPPMPWLSMNGTSDPLIPYEGMTEGTIKYGKPQPAMLSADATFQFWSARDQCGPISAGTRLPHRNDSDPTWAEKKVCTGLHDRQSVQYIFHGAGHNWPNMHYGPLVRALVGASNQDVDAGEVVWSFFKNTL